jgi:hypothetical protein
MANITDVASLRKTKLNSISKYISDFTDAWFIDNVIKLDTELDATHQTCVHADINTTNLPTLLKSTIDGAEILTGTYFQIRTGDDTANVGGMITSTKTGQSFGNTCTLTGLSTGNISVTHVDDWHELSSGWGIPTVDNTTVVLNNNTLSAYGIAEFSGVANSQLQKLQISSFDMTALPSLIMIRIKQSDVTDRSLKLYFKGKNDIDYVDKGWINRWIVDTTTGDMKLSNANIKNIFNTGTNLLLHHNGTVWVMVDPLYFKIPNVQAISIAEQFTPKALKEQYFSDVSDVNPQDSDIHDYIHVITADTTTVNKPDGVTSFGGFLGYHNDTNIINGWGVDLVTGTQYLLYEADCNSEEPCHWVIAKDDSYMTIKNRIVDNETRHIDWYSDSPIDREVQITTTQDNVPAIYNSLKQACIGLGASDIMVRLIRDMSDDTRIEVLADYYNNRLDLYVGYYTGNTNSIDVGEEGRIHTYTTKSATNEPKTQQSIITATGNSQKCSYMGCIQIGSNWSSEWYDGNNNPDPISGIIPDNYPDVLTNLSKYLSCSYEYSVTEVIDTDMIDKYLPTVATLEENTVNYLSSTNGVQAWVSAPTSSVVPDWTSIYGSGTDEDPLVAVDVIQQYENGGTEQEVRMIPSIPYAEGKYKHVVNVSGQGIAKVAWESDNGGSSQVVTDNTTITGTGTTESPLKANNILRKDYDNNDRPVIPEALPENYGEYVHVVSLKDDDTYNTAFTPLDYGSIVNDNGKLVATNIVRKAYRTLWYEKPANLTLTLTNESGLAAKNANTTEMLNKSYFYIDPSSTDKEVQIGMTGVWSGTNEKVKVVDVYPNAYVLEAVTARTAKNVGQFIVFDKIVWSVETEDDVYVIPDLPTEQGIYRLVLAVEEGLTPQPMWMSD